MKDFKILFKRRKEANQERAANSSIFNTVFAQSFIIARAFGMREVREEHLLLALIKYAPESLSVRYMETLRSKESWKVKLHGSLLNNVPENNQKGIFFEKTRIYQLIKNVHLERELLQCKTIDENCILLSLLRYQDFEGLVYKDAIQFMKKIWKENDK